MAARRARARGQDEVLVVTRLTFQPLNTFAGRDDEWAFYAMLAGRPSQNVGRYGVFGSHYVWDRMLDAEGRYWGTDPGGRSGSSLGTGHRIDYAAGSVITPAQQAAAWLSTVNGSIPGYSATLDGDDLLVTGPAAVTFGAAWDSSSRGGITGSEHARVDGPSYAEGPTAIVVAVVFTARHSGPIECVRMLNGGLAGTSPRFWLRNYDAGQTLGTLLADFGLASTIPVDGFIVWAPPGADPVELVQGQQYVALYSHDQASGPDQTTLGFYPQTDAAHISLTGDLLRVTSGENGDPAVAPAAAAPSSPTLVSESTLFYPVIEIVVAGGEGDASHGSETAREIGGIVDDDPASEIDADNVALCWGFETPFEGFTFARAGYFARTARESQWRLGIYTGGTFDPPGDRSVIGATLLVDYGNTSGSAIDQWVNADGTTLATVATAGTLCWCVGIHPPTNEPVGFTPSGDNGPVDRPVVGMRFSGNFVYSVESVAITGNLTDASQPLPATVTGTTLDPSLPNGAGDRFEWLLFGATAQEEAA